MSFLYPLLLGGLAAAAAPVLLHLVLKQQPKLVKFPAFRFLAQNQRTNQRKLRLRNLLLLLARMLLIALVCLALSRPTVFSERLNLVGERPAAVVLLFDTSVSMEYRTGGKSSLELAVQKAKELIDDLPEGSPIAIINSGTPGGTWFQSATLAREHLQSLKVSPANGPLTSRLSEAYRLFTELDTGEENKDATLPRFLYLFTDRTASSWDATRQHELEALRENLGKGVTSLLIDVGPESPVDVAVLAVDQAPRSLVTQQRLQLRAAVRAQGADCDTELICKIDGEPAGEHKLVRLKAGQSQVITFERSRLTPGWHQAVISLATSDSMPANDAVYATFEIRAGRQVLIIVDNARDADILKLALESTEEFKCDVRTPLEVAGQRPQDLMAYRCICLLNVAKPPALLWQLLEQFVKEGGGLAVMPGGTQLVTSAYADTREANLLMPGKLVRIITSPSAKGAIWRDIPSSHGLLAPFREFSKQMGVDFERFPPAAQRYWEVQPAETNSYVVVSYADDKKRPALLERTFDPHLLRGKVVLFTTPMDTSHIDTAEAWNDYVKTSFYLVLSSVSVGYLSGDAEERVFNFRSGQPVSVPLPANARYSTYLLEGPGLNKDQAVVRRPDNQNEVVLTQAIAPGNYLLLGGQGERVAYFSVNLPAEESQWDKVPPEQIEPVLGAGSVLAADRDLSLKETLQKHWNQPLELFPGLMILALFLLAIENLLSNRFYNRPGKQATTAGAKQAA
ncbi:MAG TPA: vWA domain-containing protein [Gemmataceae bacterium]|nr:vWA domain-containing protein [Gemmataceae bacterium]